MQITEKQPGWSVILQTVFHMSNRNPNNVYTSQNLHPGLLSGVIMAQIREVLHLDRAFGRQAIPLEWAPMLQLITFSRVH